MKVELQDEAQTWRFELESGARLVVGSGETADVQLPGLAPEAYAFEPSASGLRMVELQSGAASILRDGDQLQIGGTVLSVALETEAVADTELMDALLPPRATASLRCLRCGQRAPDALPLPSGASIAWYCTGCRQSVLQSPSMPSDYTLLRRLGVGANGAVYLVEHARFGRCAAKLMLPRVAQSDRMRRMFMREAFQQARLEHPNIVAVHDFQEPSPGIFCLLMEFVDGPSAAGLVAEHPEDLPVGQAVKLVWEALAGLGYAHAQGVVHRDVKDANILVGEVAKLCDFGLAKAFGSVQTQFTKTGEIAGTPAYIAPEQILDFRAAGPSADLYAMGVTLYRLLCGQYPRPVGQIWLPVDERPLRPLSAYRPDAPEGLGAAVERALEVEPADRYPDAEAMRAALGPFAG